MSSLKDQIIEKLKEEILDSLSGEFTEDLNDRLMTQLRNKVENELLYDEYQAARAEIALEVYEFESDEIKSDVKAKIWKNHEPILDYTERTLREFKVELKEDVEDMVEELKESILTDLKDKLRIFVETELQSYWTAEMRQILRDELSNRLFD